nr:unnamed protein product [Spirometra erinaceieuropaei]
MGTDETPVYTIQQLHDAVAKGDLPRVEVILSNKMNIDECDEEGLTALQQACFRGNVELARILVNHGADVNWSKHKQGYTALMFAAISGNLNLVSFLLSCGASVSATNSLNRTASEMAAFVGNYFVVALISNFIDKEKIAFFSTRKEANVAKIPAVLVDPLHYLVVRLNFAPVKVFLYLSSPTGKPLLEQWKSVVSVLEELLKQYFTPHQTHEALALKFHLLACCVRRAGEFYDSECSKPQEGEQKEPAICLEPLIKLFLRGGDPHGLPMGQERFLRRSISTFPRMESTLWQQVVRQVSDVEPGLSPTALSILENSINGLSPFSRSATGRGLDTEPCATCADMGGGGSEVQVKRCSRCREVAYCSTACQRLHWFTHKKYCPILKEHHEAVARHNAELAAKKEKTAPPPVRHEVAAELQAAFNGQEQT